MTSNVISLSVKSVDVYYLLEEQAAFDAGALKMEDRKLEDRKMQDQLQGWKMQEQVVTQSTLQHVQPLANAEGGFRRLVPTFRVYRQKRP